MRVVARFGAGLGLLVVLGVACKDSGGPVTPNVLVRVAGDTQVTLTGNQLSIPLTVRVSGSDSRPFSGATVTWTVTAGSATLGSATALSDAQGLATTTLTFGATPGAVGVQASVDNVTPVAFNECASDHPVLALNDTVSAALATTDCRFGGYYTGFFTDLYELSVAGASQGFVLTQQAAFDAYLELYLRSGSFVGFDNDVDSVNTNSRLTAVLGPGDYLLAPSSNLEDIVGPYTIAAVTGSAALADCDLVWVTPGVDISDSVTTADCEDATNGRYYADVVAMRLEGGTTLLVNHRSTAFDAALFLHNGAGIGVASNNDSANAGTTTNAFISFPVVTTGTYLLFIGTNDSLATGGYDLSIASSATLAGSPRDQGRGPQVLRIGGLRWPTARAARSWSRTGR